MWDKNCPVAKGIIWELHLNFGHAGIYKLSLLKQEFWVINGFITIKRILKECFIRKKLNNQTIKLNTNEYKEFRLNPESILFRNVAIDHIGPFEIKNSVNKNIKIYLLIITCLKTRAINLII